jgi:hypothetical protein
LIDADNSETPLEQPFEFLSNTYIVIESRIYRHTATNTLLEGIVSEYCLTPIQANFSYIMARTSYFLTR